MKTWYIFMRKAHFIIVSYRPFSFYLQFINLFLEELMKRLDEQANLMKQKFEAIDTKIEKVAAMGPVGGGPVVRNTGIIFSSFFFLFP